MFPTDQATAASSLPTPATAGTQGYFTNGNPASGVAATIVDADWLNMVQQELINVVLGGGIALSKTTYSQVLSAIKRICQNTTVLADTGAANAYTATNAVPLVAGASPTWVDGVMQAVKIAHANTGASTYAPDGLAAIPIYGLGLQPLQGSELVVGGTAILMHATISGVNSGNPICVLMECAGGAQQVAAATQSQHAVQWGQVRKVLTANLNLYVATTGSDSNTGLTSGSPFLTLQKAYIYLQQNYDLGGQYTATINVAAGTYTVGLLGNGPVIGAAQTANVVINGAGSGSTIINVAGSTSSFSAATGARFTIQNLTIQSSGSGSNGIVTNDPLSSINVNSGVTFGAFTGGTHIFATGGIITVSANYTISGGAAYHMFASNNNASIQVAGSITVTLTGTPAFSGFYAAAQYLGQINAANITFSGSATGARYIINNNALIYTGGAATTYLPGNAAGSTSAGGIYA